MTWFKFLLPGFLIFSTISFISSCSDNQEKVEKSTELVPPSLQNKEEEKSEPIILSDDQAKELSIKTYLVEKSKINYTVACPANVFPAPDQIGIISAPVSGRVTAIKAHEGDFVKAGNVLAEIESLEFINMIHDYISAVRDYEYRLKELGRLEQLAARNISSKSDLENNKYLLRKASGEVKISQAKLLAVGLEQKELKKWEDRASDEHTDLQALLQSEGQSVLNIRAEVSGYINEHYIDLGQSVNIYDKMLTVIGIEKVMIKGYLSPSDAYYVNRGDKLVIKTKKDKEKRIFSEIHTINPALDETNKSIIVNVIANTINNWPKPGQNVRLEIDASTEMEVISIPVEAIVFEEDRSMVFVKKSNKEYEKRYIMITRMAGDKAIISEGLKIGEELALTQVFSLKAMAKFKEYAD